MGTDDLHWKRKRRNDLRRKTGWRGKPLQRFLVVCEGKRTEPEYFSAFPLNSQLLKVKVHGTGRNTLSLVEETLKLKKVAEMSGEGFDQVWCVFDNDSFTKQKVNSAFELARQNKVEVAFSHEAFELWYLLHFDYFDMALSRSQYKKMLTERLGFPYKKNDEGMYEVLLDRQKVAIKNSIRLLETHHGKLPCDRTPSTTVHKLVIELNKSLKS
ncbi:MAG: RloB domain-containing protein [Nitrospinae bacterium]|nr:RloB domain-containing protein [Nitrospinota bacterium]